jgi:hypothetical protein
MATKNKKKVKTNTKQKQKQTQKQNVVVNINTEKKKSTKKKQSKNQSSSQPTNRPLRPTAETAYNRVITQSQPMLIQQVPNNNDLIGAIHQIANKFQQPPAPVQYNPELLERTMKSVQELNDAIHNSDNTTQTEQPEEPLKSFFNKSPEEPLKFTNKPPKGLIKPTPRKTDTPLSFKTPISPPLSLSPPPTPDKFFSPKPYMNINMGGIKQNILQKLNTVRDKVVNPKTGRLILKQGATAKRFEKAGVPLKSPVKDFLSKK